MAILPFSAHKINKNSPLCQIFEIFVLSLHSDLCDSLLFPYHEAHSLLYKNSQMISSSIKSFGRYCVFMTQVFRRPDKWREFFKSLIFEIYKLGVDSIPLVIIISLFIGAVICIQMTLNISSPMIPTYSTGMATREILVLEFSSPSRSMLSRSWV